MLLCVAELAAQRTVKFLDRTEFADLETLTSEIIPTTATPGAREAGAVFFIDALLRTPFGREHQQAYRDGLRTFAAKRRELFPDTAVLTAAQRILLIQSIETTTFFELVRTHTVMGCFSNPEYGGNRNKVGWSILGFQDHPHAAPPFGFYDGQEQP